MRNCFGLVIFLAMFIFLLPTWSQEKQDSLEKRIAKLLLQLKSQDAQKRAEAATAIGKIGMPAKSAVPKLMEALKDRDKRVRAAIISALVFIDPKVLEVLIAAIKQSPQSLKKKRALYVLEEDQDFEGELKYHKRHALVIGINNYSNYGVANLKGPNFDAAEVASVLASRFGFEDVVLVVDKKPDFPVSKGVKIVLAQQLQKNLLKQHLLALQNRVTKRDALFFFYAGHGIRGYIVPANGDPKKLNTLLSLTQVAKYLRSCDAHHTLMVLDSCFSGSILEANSGVYKVVGLLEDRSLQIGGGDNLARVFNRRAFQIITAGTGVEVVGDQIRASTRYAKLTKDRGHSPFTAVFLQALQGLTGRPDGRQLASDLGYYMNYTLVNDSRIGATQAPRYGAMGGGNGDFLFFPAYKVLNPKLVAPLYLSQKEYADLRRSACDALGKFIISQPKKDHVSLTRSAISHVGRLLEDKQKISQMAAVAFIDRMAQQYIEQVDEFGTVVSSLTQLLAKNREQRYEIARCLGRLYPYANQAAVDSMALYVKQQKALWQKNSKRQPLPPKVQEHLLQLNAKALDKHATLSKKMQHWSKQNRIYHWLNTKGLWKIGEYKKYRQQRIAKAKIALKKAGEAYDLSLNPKATEKEKNKYHAQCGVHAGQALEYIKDLEKVEDLKRKGKGLIRLALLKHYNHRLVWRTPVYGHKASVRAVAFSPDGKTLASASSDKTVRLWNVVSGRQIAKLSGHRDSITAVVFSPDGKTLASASFDKTVRLWNVVSGKQITELSGHRDSVTAVVFSSDGKALASASRDGTMRLWDAIIGKQIMKLTGHRDSVNSVAFSPDGKILASAAGSLFVTWDNTVRLWDVVSGKQIMKLSGHTKKVESVAFSSDGKTLASASFDETVRLWDVVSGKQIVKLSGHTRSVDAVAFSPDGKTLASASSDKTVKLWDVVSGKQIMKLSGHTSSVNSIAFSPDGKTLASASSDTTVRLWDAATGQQITKLTGLTSSVYAVAFSRKSIAMRLLDAVSGKQIAKLSASKVTAFSSNGKTFASFSHDTVRLWDVVSGKQIVGQIVKLSGHGYSVRALDLSPDGKTLVSFSYDTVRLWDVVSGKQITQLYGGPREAKTTVFSPNGKTLASVLNYPSAYIVQLWDVGTGKKIARFSGHRSPIKAVVFSSDGKTLATASSGRFSKDYTVRLWDVATNKQIAKLNEHSSNEAFIAFSPNGKILVSDSRDGMIRLWDVGGKQIAQLSGYTYNGKAIAFAPNSKTLASSCDNTVRLWDVATGKEIAKFSGHSRDVEVLDFSPDGKTLASASYDKTVRLWDVANGKEIVKLFHTDRIGSIAFSPDGKTLASKDKTVRLWNIAKGKHIPKLSGHKSYINAVVFSPDSKTLASASRDNTVRLWDVATGKKIAKFSGHSRNVAAIAFSPDGKTLASASSDKTVRLWDAATGKQISRSFKHRYPVRAVALSRNGKTLASASGDLNSKDYTVRIWEIASGKQIAKRFRHTDIVKPVAFSPDGKTLAFGLRDCTVRLWDVANGKQIIKLSGHTFWVDVVAFSPDGKTLASAASGVVRLWNVVSGKEIAKLSEYDVKAIAFSPDGKTLVFGGFDDIVKLWDVASSKEITQLSAHTSWIKAVAFSPDGKTLASGSDDNTVRLWDVATEKQIAPLTDEVRSVVISPDGKNIASRSKDKTVTLWDVATGRKIATTNKPPKWFAKTKQIKIKSRFGFATPLPGWLTEYALEKQPKQITETLFKWRVNPDMSVEYSPPLYLWDYIVDAK